MFADTQEQPVEVALTWFQEDPEGMQSMSLEEVPMRL